MARRNIPEEKKAEYLEYILTPPGEREPATKEEMAIQLGVHRKTIYNWEMSEEFQAELRSLRGKWGARWYGDILARLMEVVLKGSDSASINAAKVLLTHLDVSGDKNVETEVTNKQVDAIKKALKDTGYQVIEN